MSAQFFASALKSRPEIPAEMQRGKFDTLRGWLTEKPLNIADYLLHAAVHLTGSMADRL